MPQDPNVPSSEPPDFFPEPGSARRPAPLVLARNQPQALTPDLRQPEQAEREDEINLLDYWRILVKRRWVVAGTVAMVLVLALVGTLLTTPIYRATTTMQIERDGVQVLQVAGMNPADNDYNDDFYQTQYELMQSRSLSERVVSQLGLAESGELDRLWPPSPWAKLRALVGGKPADADKAPGKQVAAKADPDRLDQLANAFSGGIDIEPVRKSRLVRINYDSPDPAFSQRAANALAEAFIATTLERHFDSASYAKGYLEDRLQELKLKLEDSERKLVAFAQKEQIVSSGETSGANLSEQNLGSMNAAYAKATEDRIRAQSRWQQVQALHGVSLLGADAGDSSLMKTLQESRSKLMADYQDKLQLYKPGFPLMVQLKGQIDEVNKQIAVEESSIRAGIKAQYDAAVQQEHMLAAQMSGLKGEVLDLQNRSIQYNIYKREVDTNRQLYDGLLQRYKEIGVAGGVSNNNISIVDRAEPGDKFKPSLSRNLMLALLGGLLVGVLLAFAFEYLDDTFKRPEDMERLLGLPVLGAIPLLKSPQTATRALEDARSAFSEAYRSLRTALQFATEHGVPRTLLITSAMPAEGKSTTTVVLAQQFAQLGKRVLIIDCDLRNPTLHRTFKVENTVGLSNFLAGASKPMDMIQSTATPGLSYMPTGPLPPNPAELLMNSKMVSLLTVAAEKYDVVLLDGPPVMGLADAPILSNMAQGTLLVVQAGQTRVAVARNAVKRLHAARARLVGGLLTHFQSQHAGEGYGYGGYNYYAYGGNPKLTRQ